MSDSRWRRTVGHNGWERWESDLGTAYTAERPPESDPLTRQQVAALPSETRVLVLWAGGNGPHQYVWRDGQLYTGEVVDRLVASVGPLGGTRRYDHKVWRGVDDGEE